MRATIITVLAAAALLVVSGCTDDEITYPTGDGGWQVGITLSRLPQTIADDPVFIEVRGDAINLTNGARSPDGDILVFCTSDGAFPNGLRETELATIDGRATTELMIVRPGTYEVEVTYPAESATASAVFTIGLE